MQLFAKAFLTLLILPAFIAAQDYEGVINDTIPIHMKLTLQQDAISGFYLYEKVGKQISLKGTKAGDHVEFIETDASGKSTGKFDGMFWENLLIQGTWSAPDGKKKLPFRVLEVRPDDKISGQYEMNSGHGEYEGTLNLLLLKNGKVTVQGDATWIGNPDTGNVNLGDVDGVADLKGNQIFYGAGGGDNDCKFTIILSEDALEVKDDTMNCGGMNVTFEGTYGRSGPPSFVQNLD
jgi:hypothetical protein